MNKKYYKIAIAQINSKTGDIDDNTNKIKQNIDMAISKGADIILISPMVLSGLNIKDMAFNSDFTIKLQQKLKNIIEYAKIDIVLSIPNGYETKILYYKNGSINDIKNLDFDIHHHLNSFGNEEIATSSGIHLKALGGFDENIYTGGTTVINPDGNRIYQMKFFEDDFAVLDFENKIDGTFCLTKNTFKLYENEEFIWSTLCLGLRDYVKKSGFSKVLLGMSGGMDSAFVASLAVDALGYDNVYGIALPSRYSSELSEQLAQSQCERLKVKYDKISIEPMFSSFEGNLTPYFNNIPTDVTEENLQSRIRGATLMALSNKLGYMLLATGNKSEGAVGYCTLYGDTCGGFNPVKDLYKTKMYHLAKWRNKNKPELALGDVGEVILNDIINRPPTAELRENQKDSDSLPDYPILDTILFELIENGKSPSELHQSFDASIVNKVYQLMLRSQFKRIQTTTGAHISNKPLSKFNISSTFEYKI